MSGTKALTGALLLTLTVTAACSSKAANGGSGKQALNLAFFQGAVAGPEAIIAANSNFSDKVSASLVLKPIPSGVAGVAQLKSGDISGISGVGNPPTTAAIGTGTKLKIVYVESIDSAALVVDKTISGVDGLKGKKVGALVGSTLDFAIRGYLKTKGLTSEVTVTPFSSESALDAAFKAGQIHAAYLSASYLGDAVAHGGKRLVESAEIAKSGYAALNLLIFSQSYVDKHADIVAQVVCQTVRAQALLGGSGAAPYITKAADLLGVKPAVAISGTSGYPYVTTKADELAWLEGPDGTAANSNLVTNLKLVANFLIAQSRLTSVPSDATLAASIDPSYAAKAWADPTCTTT
jgi:ABC-type taurine transport system substrate-binding protein